VEAVPVQAVSVQAVPAPPNLHAVELLGGLGNQLFQYAAARALSLRAGTRLLLDASAIGSSHTPRQYALDPFAIAGEIVHNAADLPPGLVDYRESGMPFDERVPTIPRGTRLRGFFQSEIYFRDASATLRTDLKPRRPLSALAEASLGKIRAAAGAIAIQVRRGDVANDPVVRAMFGICEEDYYRRAMTIVAALGAGGCQAFVFSGNRTAAAALLREVTPFTLVETQEDWEDLVLMSACQHHVIANSTFGWWGAWLADGDGVLVAPRRWFGEAMLRQRNICDLMPERAVLA